MHVKTNCNYMCQFCLGKRHHSPFPSQLLNKLDNPLHCGLSSQEDSEDGDVGRIPSEELVSEAEPATDDGEVCFWHDVQQKWALNSVEHLLGTTVYTLYYT